MSAPATAVAGRSEPLFRPLTGPRGALLRLRQCAHMLEEHVRRLPTGAAPPHPADRWLEENHSFLQFQIRETRRNLPPGYVRKLLKAGQSPHGDEPRIYRIAADHVAKASGTDIDVPGLAAALGQHGGLKLCELWAYGTMLQLALLERLCADLDSEPVVSACVRSLRGLENVSWRDLVESVSATEEVLRRDPAGIYAWMDFETRDRYRHEVEDLAQRSGLAELEVAEAVIESARQAESLHGPEDARAHAGYHLIGAGAAEFSRSLGCRPSLRHAAAQVVERWPGLLYASCFLCVAALIVAGFDRLAGPLPLWMIGLLLVPASQAALEIVNSAVCHCLPPCPLPSMDFENGVPDSCQTMVAVPALLLSTGIAARLIEDLEIRYLANRDPNVLFGLLTDLPDADQPETEADAMLNTCVDGIKQLNARYGAGRPGPFYLFHRPRRWNPKESKWMGYERKRGKLNDLNQLLLGRANSFDIVIGDRSRFPHIRYVITLDADTQLPRDTAAKLIACMAHPLNRPVLDPATQTVTEGYGLIRPRVSVSMESAGRSRFAQVFSGMAGFDPYATVVSDVYQDFFGLTSFTGKGIYDLRAFHAAVGDRFPDNAILSHDLIEGEHVRTGFLPSVELVEDYPATYQAFSKRKHRWARGDWQLLPWLLSGPRGNAAGNPLGLLSRWKIFDNLRRSLAEITLVLLLVAGWASASHSWRWTLTILALLQLPSYLDILLSMLHTPQRRLWPPFARALAGRLLRAHRDTFFCFVFLPHQAFLMADAITRTLFRRFITRRKLLEWETMAQSEAAGPANLGIVGMYLYLSSASALVFLIASGYVNLALLLICELWIAAPLIAWWLNESSPNPAALSDNDRAFLGDCALRTWRFFADHNGAEQHWLIPDNVQLDPPLAANRISPTNLGLLLTAQLAAHDLGYVTLSELSTSLRHILDSMTEMPRYRGHFYNWYDTVTLLPAAPCYISSVDSGNLAASLCTLRQGILALHKQPWLGPQTLAGLRDHVLRLRDQLPCGLRSLSIMRLLASLLRQLDCQPTDLFFWEGVLTEVSALITRLQECLRHAYARHAGGRGDANWEELKYWDHLLAERVNAALSELYTLAPWLTPEFETQLRVTVCDASLAAVMAELSPVPALAGLPQHYERVRERLIERLSNSEPLYPALRETLCRLLQRLPEARASALELIQRTDGICSDVFRLFDQMDFAFLFDKRRKLLRVGYDVLAGRPDEACYDLLASEARTAVFLAIAKGDIPREAWFRLGRKLTAYRNHRTLVSWSGTLFEYLMPLLHLRTHENTLLDRAVRGAVRIQQVYARERHIPWGISEAAYSVRDSRSHYQYRAFGVPALSARPDRSSSRVVAPYASMLALSLDPVQATGNLRWLASLGCMDRHGFFESLDYSAPGNASAELIRCHMAHHQGMGLLAIDNALSGGPMQERFHLDPMVQATEFLLEERMPALVDVVTENQQQAAA
ncbi:MAG TPA: glucoamylase family protein [Bryobacteraceae bacterium]|nr:glucoamylase family protein [Bryobacteraceae bacterium]